MGGRLAAVMLPGIRSLVEANFSMERPSAHVIAVGAFGRILSSKFVRRSAAATKKMAVNLHPDCIGRHFAYQWGFWVKACMSGCMWASIGVAPVFATTPELSARSADAAKASAVPLDPAHKQTLSNQCSALHKLLKILPRDACSGVVADGFEVARSHLGRPIFALRTGAALTDKTATRVLILGAVHGDELTSGWLSLKWASFAPPLTDKRKYAVLHVPIVNPDGVFAAKPTRTNGRGVDLNRNFPTPQWNPDANRWWVGKTKRDPRRFPGHSAASELETKYIMRVIDTFNPTVVVSVHAPLGVLDYDGGGLPPERIGSIFLDSLGIYPGSLGHFGSRSRGVPVLTVELPHAINPVSGEETKRMWRDLFAWIDKYSNFDSQSK